MTNEERQQHIRNIEWLYHNNAYSDETVASLEAAADCLEREGQMESQPSPDLEPVRRLIEAATPQHGTGVPLMTGFDLNKLPNFRILAEEALPTLRSLLAEVERLREENAACIHRNAQLLTEKKIAVEVERGACAQVALGVQISETSLCAEWGRQCAAAIRRRK